MSKFFKFSLCLILSALCALSMFACGANTQPNTDTSGGDSETGNPPSQSGGSQSGGEYELTFPTVSVNFSSGAPTTKDDGYKPCSVSTAGDDSVDLINDCEAQIKIRGNSTAEGDKKPYRIKFAKKQPMLGLNDGNKFKSWVLLADCFDYSMSRNYFILQASKMFTAVYSSDCRYVNLYFDGEYQGVYLLAEQTQINKNRVNVDENNVETSENTGYLLEADTRALTECVLFDETGEVKKYYVDKNESGAKTVNQTSSASDFVPGADYCFDVTYSYKTSKGTVLEHQLFAVKNDLSSNGDVAVKQLKKIQTFMQSCYDVIFNDVTKSQFEELIDVNSAVDMYIINNLASLRGGKRSDFYSVDFTLENPKLTFGPPWDYDLDCANYNIKPAKNGGTEDNFYGDDPSKFSAALNPAYVLGALNEKPFVVEGAKIRWKSVGAYTKLIDLVDSIDPEYGESIPVKHKGDFDANFALYNFLGKKTYFAQSDAVLNFTSHEDAAKYFAKWMRTHVNYANTFYAK